MNITDNRKPTKITYFGRLSLGDEFVMVDSDGNEWGGVFVKTREINPDVGARQNSFCFGDPKHAYFFDDTAKVKRVSVECVVSDFVED